MAGKIIEGLWDCPYCKTKGIGGLTKHCPCCGHPQDEGTRFYMGERKNYLDEELAKQYGQGADWLCPYCGSLNRIRFQYCSNCGSPKDGSQKDYFSVNPHTPKPGEQTAAPEPVEQTAPKQTAVKPKKVKKRLFIFLAIAAVLIALLAAYWPRTYDAEVSTTAWAREIDVEQWRTVHEADWDVPAGGRVTDQKREFHHYVQVLDHYETKTRTVSEQVYDGEDTHTYYSDNGDGTFSEETYTTPRYRTEYRTETYQDPVYRDDPVYATKYYYDIERWIVDREEKTEGADCEPYWPDYTLGENERKGFVGEAYVMTVKSGDNTYKISLPYNRWSRYKKGDKVEITVVAGNVTKLDGEEID